MGNVRQKAQIVLDAIGFPARFIRDVVEQPPLRGCNGSGKFKPYRSILFAADTFAFRIRRFESSGAGSRRIERGGPRRA